MREAEPVVVVSGLPRSGTSMVMQMLSAGGLTCATDGLRAADEDNPRGYFEVERVKRLDKEGDRSWLREYQGQAVKVISFLLRHLPGDLRYRVLFIHRDLQEVLASQRRMLLRRGEDPEAVPEAEMARTFADHMREVEAFLEEAGNFDALHLDHGRILSDPATAARTIDEFLGGGLDRGAMAAAVDASLHRNRRVGSPGEGA